MLIGRSSELKYLQQLYEVQGSQLVIIYGQTGIGKTSLALEFSKNLPCFYYQARSCTDQKQQNLWQTLDLWMDAKNTGFLTGKKVLVVDEFQHLVKSDPDFMQNCVTYLQQPQEILWILLSSSIAWIENSMITKIGTSAYSISALYKLKEISFQSIRSMFPHFNQIQCLEIYSILGGVPRLLQSIDDRLSVSENLIKNILNTQGTLYQIGTHLISEELRETSVYHTILESLSSGKQKLNELFKETGFSRAKISVYLKNLMELEFVEKIFSYDTDGKENTQKGIYRICNHFAHFWFGFVFPNLGELEIKSGLDYYNTYIKSYFTTYTSIYFKNVCVEYLMHEAEERRTPFVIARNSTWVGKAGVIDLIMEGENGYLAVGFCQYARIITTYADYEWDLFCLEQAKIQPDGIYLFSVKGFDEQLTLEAAMNPTLQLLDFEMMYPDLEKGV
ncbi:MAG: ATP-binding protein [Lachnospiraceae bacterium]